MARAEINIAGGINRRGPDIRLFSVEELIEARRQGQNAIIGDRHTVRFTFQQFRARAHLPDHGLAGRYAG